MPVFEYTGWNVQGKKTQGVVDADGPKAARLKLKGDGIYATDLNERTLKKQKLWKMELSFRRGAGRLSAREISIMTRQLSTLVGASLPIVTALNALVEQVENEQLKAVLADVRERINEGSSFADALACHPKVFENLYVNMVRAGESSGALEIVLARLADFLEGQAALKGKITAALVYPAIMSVLAVVVIAVMVGFVIPQVRTIFDETGRALPLPTQILLAITDFIQGWWWLMIVLIGGAVYGFKRYVSTDRGRSWFDGFRLNAPLFGQMILLVALSRFTRTLATLLTSGVTMMRSLDIVKHVVNNVHLKNAIENARESVSEGSNFADPLKSSKLFPPIVTHMVAVGERTGQLEEMLARVADAYDTEIETKITALTSVLEPILIVIMGAVIFVIVISVLLPIFQMAQGL